MIVAVDNHVHNCIRLRGRRQQDRVDDMHHAVVSCDVRNNDHRVIDHHTFRCNGYRHIFTEQRFDHLTVSEVCGVSCRAHNVVLQNLTEVWQRQQLLSSDLQRFRQGNHGRIVGCKNRKRSISVQCIDQARFNYSRFEQRVIVAVHDDVHYGDGRRRRVNRDCGDHTVGSMRTNRTIVIVYAFQSKCVRTEANTFSRSADSRSRERFRVVPNIADRACHAIHIVKSVDVHPNHGLSRFNFEGGRSVHEARRFHDDAFNTARIVLCDCSRCESGPDEAHEVKNFFHSKQVVSVIKPIQPQKVHKGVEMNC